MYYDLEEDLFQFALEKSDLKMVAFTLSDWQKIKDLIIKLTPESYQQFKDLGAELMSFEFVKL